MRRWLKPAVSVVLLVAIFWVLPWDDVRAAAGRLSPLVWAAVLAGFLAGHRLGAAKWRLLVNAGRAGLSARDAVRCYAAGLFSNLCLPTVVGGDVLRAALAARATGRREAAIFGGVADRTVDIAVTGLLVAAGGMLSREHYPGWTGDAVAVAALVGVLGAAAALPLLVRRPLARWPRRLRRPVGRNLVVLRRLRRAPRAAALAALASLAMQGGFVLLNAWIGRSLGIDVPLAVWFFAWPLAKVAGLLPISLGGLAVRDATLAALLAPAGVPPTLGVVAGLAWQTVMIAGGLLAGALWWAMDARPDVRAALTPAPAPAGASNA